jgi:membrane protein DedA with SNARE-associated domain
MLGIVGIPLPDEVLLTFAGYLVFKGHLTLSLTIATAFLGSACGRFRSAIFWGVQSVSIYLYVMPGTLSLTKR